MDFQWSNIHRKGKGNGRRKKGKGEEKEKRKGEGNEKKDPSLATGQQGLKRQKN